MLPGQFDEIDRIAGNADGELRVLLWMIHGVQQRLTVHHIDVHVVAMFFCIGVQQRHKISDAVLLLLAEGLRHNGEGIGDAVFCILKRNLCYRGERCQRAVGIPAMHGIGAGCQRYTALSAVRSRTGRLAIDHIGGDGQNRLCRNRPAIGLLRFIQ